MSEADIGSWISPQRWGQVYEETIDWAVRAMPKILLIFLVAALLLKALAFLCGRIERHALSELTDVSEREEKKRADTLIGIVRASGKVTIWAIVSVLLLMQVGVNVAPLIAGAGVVGLAVGFGAQELVRDVISGFFLLLENHLRNGDVAIINGTGGLVESITLRTITLRDLAGTVHIFQNGKISSLSNMTKTWSAMVFDVGVAYKEDTDRVMDVMREVSEELRADTTFGPKILEPMEIFGLDKFGDSAVVIKARLKTVPIEQWTVGREYNRRLKHAFDAAGIEIPFPQRSLSWSADNPPIVVGR